MEIEFRRLRRQDLPLLASWLSRPHVAQWWREPCDIGSVERRYRPSIDGDDPAEVFIAYVDDVPAGIAQRYLIDDEPGWKASLAPSGENEEAAGIDYFLGEEGLMGRGVGAEMISRFVEATWERYPAIARVVVSTNQANRRSWRALEKAGFTRAWAGEMVAEDPGDAGLSYVYVKRRPGP